MTKGEAINIFESQHGSPEIWNQDERRWHDLLLERLMTEPTDNEDLETTEEEDGNPESLAGQEMDDDPILADLDDEDDE